MNIRNRDLVLAVAVLYHQSPSTRHMVNDFVRFYLKKKAKEKVDKR